MSKNENSGTFLSKLGVVVLVLVVISFGLAIWAPDALNNLLDMVK